MNILYGEMGGAGAKRRSNTVARAMVVSCLSGLKFC